MNEPQTIAAVPPEKLPTHVPEDALAYWQRVLAGAEQAQRELAEIQQLEQRIVALRQAATAKLGAYESYVQHLCELLKLNQQADRIERDGHIIRAGNSENGTA